ncbi:MULTISPECIES: hypothetical protein [unclassified Microcoleus]|uniref:hypothetical protein n=1 Tax=unclassified Microcoleus TaxID=2642155 RepID=UPI002FD5DA16
MWSIELDASCENFFTNRVVASLRDERQIATEARLLGAVSGDQKKVLTLGLTDKGKLDTVIKSSERDAAHQA